MNKFTEILCKVRKIKLKVIFNYLKKKQHKVIFEVSNVILYLSCEYTNKYKVTFQLSKTYFLPSQKILYLSC